MARHLVARRTPRLYTALQWYGALAPILPAALTLYAVTAHLAVEDNPVLAAMLARGVGGVIALICARLALTISVVTQSAFCWRSGHDDAWMRRLGWGLLLAWASLTTLDALNDLSATALAALTRLR